MTTAEKQALEVLISKIDWSNPVDPNKRTLATKIVESVQQDVYSQQIVNLLAEAKTFGPGEEMQFKTDSGLVAYIIEPGSFAPRSQITNTVTTLPKKLITVATELEIGQLRSGRYGTISDLKAKALEQILGAQNAMLWSTAWRSVTSTSSDNNYASVSTAATVETKKAALDTAISRIADYSNTNIKAIVGRYSSLDFLEGMDKDFLPDDMLSDLYKREGFLTVYRGIPVFRLKSFKDGYGVQHIGADNIMVIGDGGLVFGTEEPGLEIGENYHATTTRVWEMAMFLQVGAAAINSKRLYRIQLV